MNTPEDEIAIRNLMATYVDAANRRDGEAWKATWVEDAVWELLGNPVECRDNILSLWSQVLETFDFALLIPSSGMFEVNGDHASGHWYLQEHTRNLKGEATSMISRYLDTYTRVEGSWLYQSRAYSVIYTGPADLSGQYIPRQD